MAKDEQAPLNMSEFLDALERGKRTYEGFKYAIEIGQRLANHEQVERELIAKANSARQALGEVEAEYEATLTKCNQAVTDAKAKSSADLAAVQKAQDEAISKIEQSAKQRKEELHLEFEALSAKVESKKIEVSQLQQQITDQANELRRIDKQISNAREAKRALLEA